MKKNILIYMGALLLGSSFLIHDVKPASSSPSLEPFVSAEPQLNIYQACILKHVTAILKTENVYFRLLGLEILDGEDRVTTNVFMPIYMSLFEMCIPRPPEREALRSSSPRASLSAGSFFSGSDFEPVVALPEDLVSRFAQLVDLAAQNTVNDLFTLNKSLLLKLKAQTFASPVLLREEKEHQMAALTDEIAQLRATRLRATESSESLVSELPEGSSGGTPSAVSTTTETPKDLGVKLLLKLGSLMALRQKSTGTKAWLEARSKILPAVFAEFIANTKKSVTAFITKAKELNFKLPAVKSDNAIDAAFAEWEKTSAWPSPEAVAESKFALLSAPLINVEMVIKEYVPSLAMAISVEFAQQQERAASLIGKHYRGRFARAKIPAIRTASKAFEDAKLAVANALKELKEADLAAAKATSRAANRRVQEARDTYNDLVRIADRQELRLKRLKDELDPS